MKPFLVFISLSFLFTASAQTPLDIVNAVDLDSMYLTLQEFSGETATTVGGESVVILSRGQANNDLAADYLVEQFNTMNTLSVNDQAFNANGRNIVATQLGKVNPDDIYIICAHYDSVADYCADDNASGVAAVLEIARILSTQCMENTLVYALWDEEEIGLLGADYYATLAQTNGDTILGVLNIDMMGYDGDNDNDFDIDVRAIANSIAIKDDILSLLADYEFNLNANVVNPGTPASDHSKFWNKGYSAVLVGESWANDDQTPYYHSSGDRLNTLDLPYYHELSKLIMSYMVSKGGLLPIDNSVTTTATQLTSNFENGTYQWFDCNTNLPLAGQVGQTFSPEAEGSYSVEVTLGSCIEFSDCIEFTTLGVEEFNLLSAVKIYPNPAMSTLNIEHPLIEGMILTLFSIDGKKLIEKAISKKLTKIDISKFSKGVYLIQLTQGSNNFSQQIVIHK
jgi:hypothetical protein